MAEQLTRIVGRYFFLHPEHKSAIDELREKGLPDEAAAILTVVAERMANFAFASSTVAEDDESRIILKAYNYAASECYKVALDMAREVMGE